MTNPALVGFASTGSGTARRVSTLQWDAAGTPVSMANELFQLDEASNVYAEIWGVTASGGLTSGTKQVKITPAASCEITGGSASYQFVNQTTMWNPASPLSAAGHLGTTTSITITSAINETVVAIVAENGGETLVVGSGQTPIHNDNIGSSNSSGASSDEAGAATVVMDWTGRTGGQNYCIGGASLQFDASGGAAAVATRPAFRRTIPMLPGPGGLTRGTPVAQATSNALTAFVFTPPADSPRPLQMNIPMRPTAGGFALGIPVTQSRGTPATPAAPGSRRRIRLIT